ncbi:MAG TPA: sigma-70 family RNA polymerase sigma factor [Blastocatellia bacterium]|nr:sigma-70 family RNA polymerase sigma factor [Blastocatellia bacterium]
MDDALLFRASPLHAETAAIICHAGGVYFAEGRSLMPTPPSHEVTQLLLAWSDGDRAALDQLVPLVYGELRRLAKHHLRRERAGHTLQSAALIHEAYLRLIDVKQVRWENRAHFFAAAARLMRQILVDLARERGTRKRGGDARQVSLDEALVISPPRDEGLVALDEALTALAEVDARKSRVVELRFFGGLSVEETAEALKVSVETVNRDWRFAKSWLSRRLSGEEQD